MLDMDPHKILQLSHISKGSPNVPCFEKPILASDCSATNRDHGPVSNAVVAPAIEDHGTDQGEKGRR